MTRPENFGYLLIGLSAILFASTGTNGANRVHGRKLLADDASSCGANCNDHGANRIWRRRRRDHNRQPAAAEPDGDDDVPGAYY